MTANAERFYEKKKNGQSGWIKKDNFLLSSSAVDSIRLDKRLRPYSPPPPLCVPHSLWIKLCTLAHKRTRPRARFQTLAQQIIRLWVRRPLVPERAIADPVRAPVLAHVRARVRRIAALPHVLGPCRLRCNHVLTALDDVVRAGVVLPEPGFRLAVVHATAVPDPLQGDLPVRQVLGHREGSRADTIAGPIHRAEIRIVWIVRPTVGLVARKLCVAGGVECGPVVGLVKGDHGQAHKATRVVEPLPLDGESVAAADGLDRIGRVVEDRGLGAFGLAGAVATGSGSWRNNK